MFYVFLFDMQYKIELRLPTVLEYSHLRTTVAWPAFEDRVIEVALSQTLFSVCIMHDDIIVGMGRVIGDNAIYFHLQDVIVNPAYQLQGIGDVIVEQCMAYIGKFAVQHTNIGLMCSKNREPFYKRFGFIERPNALHGAGMIKIIT